jgi:hypothetical protein
VKKTLILSIGVASLLIAGGALAQSSSSSSKSATSSPSWSDQQKSDMKSSSDQKSDKTAETGTSAARPVELSGELKTIDKDARSLTIAPTSGEKRDVRLSTSATIVRDGVSVGIEQLKTGDEVRASFDPSSMEATALVAHSKDFKDQNSNMKDKDKDMNHHRK